MHRLYEQHLRLLRDAQDACRTRAAFIPFEESPRAVRHPAGAKDAGFSAFEERLGTHFLIAEHPGESRPGEEVSPYTMRDLGISYPRATPDELLTATELAQTAWARADSDARVGVCLEALMRLSNLTFENAFATMHTSGQAFMMAFAGSGANSLDRGLEALAYADEAMRHIRREATYERTFGRGAPVTLRKRYRLRPRGVALVVTCGSYPAWNAYPAIFANLATGNPVIVKPHPLGVLPMAIAVDAIRQVLAETGFDPNLIVLAVDRTSAPVAGELHADPRTAIVDFTGGQRFGRWLEQHSPDKLVFTETSGVNHVLLESVDELEPVLDALALGVGIFSGQMCTAPQNFLVPKQGVRTSSGTVPRDEVIERLAGAVDRLVADTSVAAAVCGAVQQSSTLDGIRSLTAVSGAEVVREPVRYQHPEFSEARTITPLVVRATEGVANAGEVFGPVAMFVDAGDRDEMLQTAVATARTRGSIANYLYSVDEGYIDQVEDTLADAGASVGVNLVRQSPINFTAAYSDYHVTGLNPAGNACLTDAAFVTSRFRIVQSKREVS